MDSNANEIIVPSTDYCGILIHHIGVHVSVERASLVKSFLVDALKECVNGDDWSTTSLRDAWCSVRSWTEYRQVRNFIPYDKWGKVFADVYSLQYREI